MNCRDGAESRRPLEADGAHNFDITAPVSPAVPVLAIVPELQNTKHQINFYIITQDKAAWSCRELGLGSL